MSVRTFVIPFYYDPGSGTINNCGSGTKNIAVPVPLRSVVKVRFWFRYGKKFWFRFLNTALMYVDSQTWSSENMRNWTKPSWVKTDLSSVGS